MSYEIEAWLQAAVRWFHIFAGIMWIGQTYLFIYMEKNFEHVDDPAKEGGNLWLVHGGGFYHVDKYRFRADMPRKLHWFKWEAGLTWLSGMLLLSLTYYMGGLLVEPEGSFSAAFLSGGALIVFGWLIYDVAAKSALGKDDRIFGVLGLVLTLAVHYGLTQVMSGRSAFMHIGVLFGTIMVANVWLRILPAQRKMIAALNSGDSLDSSLKTLGPKRSRHNAFMVIPVVFIMISNHYPVITYAHDNSTMILAAVIAAGWTAAFIMRR